jgi:ABC-2 type transport system permease protein
MAKMWSVALREYLFNLRRPSFLFAVFGVPLFTFIMWGVIFLVMDSTENNIDGLGMIGYVDQSGLLADVTPTPEDDELFIAYPSDVAARQALDEQAIGVYFVLAEDYLNTGNVETTSYNSIPSALTDRIESFLRGSIAQQLGDNVPLERIMNPVNLTVHTEDSGRDLTEANLPALVLMPMIFAFVFIMASGVTSGFLMNGVVEEKTNRIMEILVTSVTPMQLLAGKIIGLGVLGLTQMVIWGVAGAILLTLGQTLPFLEGVVFPTDIALLALVYFILSYFLIASLMAGVGVIANSEAESRQFSSIISLIWILPFFFTAQFIIEPNGTLPIILTLFPFTAPISVLIRLGFTAIPTWQMVVSLLILTMTTLLLTWASARVFRWGMLSYGKRLGLREIVRVIRRPSPFSTTASTGEVSK